MRGAGVLPGKEVVRKETEAMTDREKAINGLECCLPMTTRNGLGDCGNCPYDREITLEGGITECCHELMLDVLVLLKAQESLLKSQKLKVMTLEEIRQYMNNSPC